ncbi:Nuclear hormone receptor [Aphelenchoides avenae]|nr:Nuclear hormone receptor [Aphelenchus avenae]
MRPANTSDINDALTTAIMRASEWLERTPVFRELEAYVKRHILRDFALQFLSVECGYSSAQQPDRGLFLLPNGAYLRSVGGSPHVKEEPSEFTSLDGELSQQDSFASEIITLAADPLRNVPLDDYDVAAMKCLLLLKFKDSLGEKHRAYLTSLQSECLRELMRHCSRAYGHDGPLRFANLLLTLENFLCSTRTIGNWLQLLRIFHAAKFDPIIEDLMFS